MVWHYVNMQNDTSVIHPPIEGLTVADSASVSARVTREDADAIRRLAEAERIKPGTLIRRAIKAELDRLGAKVA